MAHTCSAKCSFDRWGRCSRSGERHQCDERCLVTTREGDRVCTWTGVVAEFDRVERNIFANTSSRDGDGDLPGQRQALGYCISRGRDQRRYGPYRRRRSESRTTASDPTRHLAPTTVDSQQARWVGVARAQARLLFGRDDVREALDQHNEQKRNALLRQKLRLLTAADGPVVAYTDLAREWVSCLRRYPRLPPVRPADGVTCEQICCAVAEFVVDAWMSLQGLRRWQQRTTRPEFESFSLGLIYICRDGGQQVHGYPLVPRLAFFETHTPSIPDLSQMHILLKEKDCRNSIIGRRRIMEGRNAISSACATECLERSVADFAIRPAEPTARVLRRSYAPAGFSLLW